jgi:anthranilate phosphoribosyltransferase
MELMGVYDESLCVPLAQVLFNLGVNKALVVYGQDGLDEISMSSPTTICEVRNGWVRNYEIKPEDFGFERCSKEELVGGSAEENAKITMDILTGKEQGPKRNVVLMNAGAAIYLAGKAETIADGVKVAAEILDSGKALEKLQEYIELSNA